MPASGEAVAHLDGPRRQLGSFRTAALRGGRAFFEARVLRTASSEEILSFNASGWADRPRCLSCRRGSDIVSSSTRCRGGRARRCLEVLRDVAGASGNVVFTCR